MQAMIRILFSPEAHGAGMAKANVDLKKEYQDIGRMTDQMVEDFRIWVQYPGEYDSEDDFVWTKPHYEVIDKVEFNGKFEYDLGSESEDSDSVMIPTRSGMPAVSFQPPETYSFGNNLHIFCRQGEFFMFKAKTADNPLQHRATASRIPFDTSSSTLMNSKVIEDV